MKMWWAALVFFLSAQASAQAVCAKGYISLRRGPGENFPFSWKVARYMPFVRLENKAGWSKLQDLDGVVHWARSSEVTTEDRCVVVRSNVANLRSEPSRSSNPPKEIKTADRYTPFKRLFSQDDWIQVEIEGGAPVWIHEGNVWKPVVVQSFNF